MGRFLVFSIGVLPLIVACDPSSSIDGTWLLTVATAESDSVLDISENFRQGRVPSVESDDDPGSGTTRERTYSDSLASVRIIGGSGRTAFMVVGGEMLPGEKVSGGWFFEWVDETTTDTNTKEEGYVFGSLEVESYTTRVVLEPSSGKAAGYISLVHVSRETYSESDEWDPATGPYSSEIPSRYYLEHTDDPTRGVRNEPDEDDCAGSTCTFELVSTYSSKTPFEAVRTDLSPDESIYGEAYDTGW